jgi:hypothetical protein
MTAGYTAATRCGQAWVAAGDGQVATVIVNSVTGEVRSAVVTSLGRHRM